MMTDRELIEKGSKEIRKNPKLMNLYIEKYIGFFGKKPNCAGCTFSTDFNKLRKKVLYLNEPKKTQKPKKMSKEKKEYVLNKKYGSKIFSYSTKKKVHRKFGRDIDDEFAKKLIKENKENEKYFSKLPKPKKESAKKPEPKKEDDK